MRVRPSCITQLGSLYKAGPVPEQVAPQLTSTLTTSPLTPTYTVKQHP